MNALNKPVYQIVIDILTILISYKIILVNHNHVHYKVFRAVLAYYNFLSNLFI